MAGPEVTCVPLVLQLSAAIIIWGQVTQSSLAINSLYIVEGADFIFPLIDVDVVNSLLDLTLTIIDDTDVEGMENFNFTLATDLASGVELFLPAGPQDVDIADNDCKDQLSDCV